LDLNYDLKIIDHPGRPFILVAEWETDEGRWKSSIPITRMVVETSNFDVISHQIRELEHRIKKRSGASRVVQRTLELPPGWSSHKGPDAMIKRIANRTIMTVTRRAEEYETNVGTDVVRDSRGGES